MTSASGPPLLEPLRRQNRTVLQFLERPALRWLSTSLPGWVTPDMLTGAGFLGAVISAVGYILAAKQPAMLWVASGGIVVNWFGDSLDGHLARARNIERPAYGFFIDNSVDVLEYAIFAVGMGLSGYVRWELVLGALAAFYMIMLLGLIKATATNVFQISFAGVGLSEVRVGFILVNVAIYFIPPHNFKIDGVRTTYPNLISATWIAIQIVTFLVSMIKTLHDLAAVDPPKRSR